MGQSVREWYVMLLRTVVIAASHYFRLRVCLCALGVNAGCQIHGGGVLEAAVNVGKKKKTDNKKKKQQENLIHGKYWLSLFMFCCLAAVCSFLGK